MPGRNSEEYEGQQEKELYLDTYTIIFSDNKKNKTECRVLKGKKKENIFYINEASVPLMQVLPLDAEQHIVAMLVPPETIFDKIFSDGRNQSRNTVFCFSHCRS